MVVEAELKDKIWKFLDVQKNEEIGVAAVGGGHNYAQTSYLFFLAAIQRG
jgi:predicted alternative tryptophan synthase beta-subunit